MPAYLATQKTLQHFLSLGGSTQCSLQTTILEQSKVRGLSQETLAVLSKNTCSALYLSEIPFVCVCVCVCVWLEKHPGTWIRNSSSGHQSFPWLSRTTVFLSAITWTTCIRVTWKFKMFWVLLQTHWIRISGVNSDAHLSLRSYDEEKYGQMPLHSLNNRLSNESFTEDVKASYQEPKI